jgi:hypothetical protein
MDARSLLSRGVSTGLRLGRGTADRVVRTAGPRLTKVTGVVVAKVRRPEPPTTTTFTPSKRTPEEPEPTTDTTESHPSPATVAHNIGPQRPTATPARARKPKSVPGAKLPPPRPSTS